MVFKGTKTRRPGDIEREIKSYGGVINGSVSLDLVDYQVTLPSKNLQEGLAILKDMFLNATFDPAEIEREREVILKEIRLSNDEPQSKIIKLLYATAYRVHPYKHPIIGHKDLLSILTRDDLVNFYNSSYTPDRMVIAIVGDIAPDEAAASVEKEFKEFRPPAYGNIPIAQQEPIQLDKRVRVQEADTTLAYIALGFHSTAITDKDLYAMDVLSMILGRGDNSRLNSALYKSKHLVHNIAAWNYTPRDPGLFVVTAILDADNLDNASGVVRAEIDKIKKDLVTDVELETARRTALGDYIYTRETGEETANDISTNHILTGNAEFSENYVEGVNTVSKEDVRRVANKYLADSGATELWLVPRGFQRKLLPKNPTQQSADNRFEKLTLDNGLRIVLHRKALSPSVAITVAMLGGSMVETEADNGISGLTSRMLFKGTRSRKQSELLGAIQRMGGDADSFSGVSSFGFTIKFLKGDINKITAIIRDVLMNSTFPEDELEKEKSRTIAMIQEEDDDIFDRGITELKKSIFPGSPYGFCYSGKKGAVASVNRQQMTDFYNKHCTAVNMVLAVSGDINIEEVKKDLKSALGDMRRGSVVTGAPVPEDLPAHLSRAIAMEREESLVSAGFRTVSLKDVDRFPIEVLGSVLSGQSGRLFTEIRDKRSLAYTLGCAQKLSMNTGIFIFYVATSKEGVTEVGKALADQINSVRSSPIPEKEIEAARLELDTKYMMDLELNEYISSTGALEELCGRGCDSIFSYGKEFAIVTASDIQRVAKRYFDPEHEVEIIITP